VLPPEQPPSTDLEVIPHTGEIVDLSDAHAVAKAYREIQDLEGKLRTAKGTLADALVHHTTIYGSKTMPLEGLGKVVVKGGTDTVYDAQAIKRDLIAAGSDRARVAQIVIETVDYKVAAVEAKKAAGANAEYAAIIERHKTVYPKRPSVSVP